MSRLEKLLQFLKESPKDSFLLFAIAKEYEKLDDDEQALAYYTKLQGIDENYIGLYYHLGKLWERKQQISKAFRIYSQGMLIAKNMGDKHALSELAGARLNLGDEEDFDLE